MGGKIHLCGHSRIKGFYPSVLSSHWLVMLVVLLPFVVYAALYIFHLSVVAASARFTADFPR